MTRIDSERSVPIGFPNSSKKNTPPLSGISSMPSSASTPLIHDVLERSPSRSLVLAKASHGDTKTRRKVPAHRAAVALFASVSAFRFASFLRLPTQGYTFVFSL